MESILIYRSELLAYSETFIATQVAAIRRYAPIFAGTLRVANSLVLPAASIVVAERNGSLDRARRLVFRRTGIAPSFVRELRAHNPQLLHAHFALDAAEALPLSRRLAIPLVVTLHGFDVMVNDDAHRATARGRLYLSRRRELIKHAQVFVCVSEAIRRKAIERGFPADKLRVLPIGIDVAQYKPAEHLPGKPRVLFVGRLVEKKGCAYLIQAMSLVQQSLPAATLIIVGDGPERARLEAEAKRLGSAVSFAGAQTAAEVRQWMKNSRIVAVPSVTARDGDAEGLPTVLYEAMATGLPVACFRNSGIPELVRDGVEGLLADERDAASLAANLLCLCKDDALAERLGAAGRRRVEESFQIETQTALLGALYDELLSDSAHQLVAATGSRDKTLQPGQIAAIAAGAEDAGTAPVATAAEQQEAGTPVPQLLAASPAAEPRIANAPGSERLRTQAAWMVSGSSVAVLMQALYFLLIGRLLGSREYGALVGVVALVNVLSQFSSLGMEMVLLRDVSRERSQFAVSWGKALFVSGVGFCLLLGLRYCMHGSSWSQD